MYNMYIHTITGGVSTITEDISTKQLHILARGSSHLGSGQSSYVVNSYNPI